MGLIKCLKNRSFLAQYNSLIVRIEYIFAKICINDRR